MKMSLNTLKEGIIDEQLLVEDSKGTNRELASAKFTHLTKERQPVETFSPFSSKTEGESEGEASLMKDNSTAPVRAFSKSHSDVTRSSDLTATENESGHTNLNINDNSGIIIICNKIKLVSGVQPNSINIGECETIIQDEEGVHSHPKWFIFPSKRTEKDQILSKINSKSGLYNRSEFCLEHVVVPKPENVYKAVQSVASTEEKPLLQTCTSTAKSAHKPYIDAEHNSNINITNNDGSVVICENGQFTIPVQPNERSFQGFETTIQHKEAIPPEQKQFTLGFEQVEENQTLSKKSIRNRLHNRSEFCLAPKAGSVDKAVQCNLVSSTPAKDMVQLCTLNTETVLKFCFGNGLKSIEIQSNFRIIIINMACDELNCKSGEASNTGSQLKNININISNNFGVIMICDNCELNFVVSLSNENIKNDSAQQVGILSSSDLISNTTLL